jgi:hypothetical protein
MTKATRNGGLYFFMSSWSKRDILQNRFNPRRKPKPLLSVTREYEERSCRNAVHKTFASQAKNVGSSPTLDTFAACAAILSFIGVL